MTMPIDPMQFQKINAARAGMGLPPLAMPGTQSGIRESIFGNDAGQPVAAPPPPPSIAAPNPTLADISKWNAPGGAATAPSGPMSDQAKIAASLGMPDTSTAASMARGGMRPVDLTAKAPGAAPAGKIDPSRLVGANTQSNQIPTVITGAVGGPGKASLQLGGVQTQNTIHDPEAQSQLKRGVQTEYEGQAQQTGAEGTQADQLAQVGQVANAGIDRRDLEMRQKEAQRQAMVRGETEKLAQLTSQVRGGEIDAKRLYANESTAERIAGAIAVAMGAYAGGKTGVNHAKDIFDKAVDRDIDEQKTNLAQKNKSLEDQKGLLATMRTNFGDERQSDAAAKMAYVDAAMRDTQQIMKENGSALIQAKGTAMLGALQQKMALYQDEFTKHTEAKSYHMVQAGGGSTIVAPHADIKKNEVVKGPDGKQYELGDGDTARKAAEQIGTINQSLEDADALASITKNAANLADPSKRAEARSIISRMVMRNGKAEGGTGTRISKESIDLAQGAMGGDPNAILNFGKSAGLAEYRRGLTSEAHGLIKQHSISEVDSFQEQNARTGEQTLRFTRKQRGPQPTPDLGGEQVGE